LTWGPFVLAYDEKRNEGLPGAEALGLVQQADQPLRLKPGSDLAFTARVRAAGQNDQLTATFVPFADAGRDGGSYRVWLRAPGVPLVESRNPANEAVPQSAVARVSNH
jgi:hypothetical protein